MDLMSGYKNRVQGVVGLVFGNENSASSEDSYVERLLDRISNGVLAEDRRTAIAELQFVVAESRVARLAFGAMGFPVLLSVLKEERDDVEMSEEDFYICYYTLQLLTEAILTIPRGITGLMDMLMDREVIRNEALLLLTYLTHEAEEIQKILVFEGAFEKIFSIIKEEGCSEGVVVVQVLLRETMGFDPLISILKLRGSSYSFTQQKTINLLSALETIGLLIMGGPEIDTGKDANRLTNKAVLVQMHRDLIASRTKNLDALASKVLGEEPQVEPALNSILRIILRTSSMQEFVAADYVFKCFCEKNPDGQAMLASTLIPQPQLTTHALPEEDVNMSFGIMLLHGLTLSQNDGDLETCSRAASVRSYVLKDNMQCKERVLPIELEEPTPSLGAPEPLLHRVVKYLALATCMKSKERKSNASGNTYVQAIILKLLVIWLSDCPSVVQCFLDSRPHLTYLLQLVSNSTTTMCIRGLAAVILRECVIYNKSSDSGKDAFTVVDAISQKVRFTSYFLKFEEMQKSIIFSSAKSAEPWKPLTRSTAASMAEIEDVEENEVSDLKNEDQPMLALMFDAQFVDFIQNLETDIRESIVDVYSHPKSKVVVVSAELQQKGEESDGDYVKQLKSFAEKQCSEITICHNATLAEDLAKIGTGGSSQPEHRFSGGSERVLLETLHRDLQEASQWLDTLKTERAEIESEASMYCNLAGKMESNLKSLSDAYNSLEQANFHLEKEIKALNCGRATPILDVEAIKAEAREEAQKKSEAELNDLLVCLRQEQSKVEKLSVRLLELGEDVDKLLERIGDDIGLQEDAEVEEDG
ncbi:hypothetical protein ACSBR2_041147 [Camellia fascicularis]